jgi:hypothetical protein
VIDDDDDDDDDYKTQLSEERFFYIVCLQPVDRTCCDEKQTAEFKFSTSSLSHSSCRFTTTNTFTTHCIPYSTSR